MADLISFILGRFKDAVEPLAVPSSFSFPNSLERVNATQPQVSWINHSTFLVEAEGFTFLTDPIWSQRCSPFPFLGPKRQIEPPIALSDLPKIDVVLISHDHYDHLDKKTVRKLHRKFPNIVWIVPTGVKKWFTGRFGKIDVRELRWGESIEEKGFSIHATPAQHFSGRSLFNRNTTLWMGCMVKLKSGKQFYFAGDTGYNNQYFKEIGKKFGPVDLSLIPIGAYLPRRFMQVVHVNPEEAVQIHQDVGSQLSLGGHFGTFKLSYESLLQPPFDLYNALVKEGISCEAFRVLRPGQKINWGV